MQRLQIHCRMFSLVKLSVRFVAKLHFRMEEGGYCRSYVFVQAVPTRKKKKTFLNEPRMGYSSNNSEKNTRMTTISYFFF